MKIRVDGIHCKNDRYKQKDKNDRFKSDKHQFPFLVRTFWKYGEVTIENYNAEKNQELQLYLFMGSTLRDIVDQLKYQLEGVYRRDVEFKLLNIYLDQHGIYKKKELGKVHSVKSRKDDDMKLKDFGFKIGDVIVVEIMSKQPN